MKKIFLSLAAMFCLTTFAFAAAGDEIFTAADESLPGKPSFKAVELEDGKVAVVSLWLTEETTEVVIPSKIWSKDEPYTEYEVSQVGNGYVLWVELNEENVAISTIKTLTVSEGITTIASSLFTDWVGPSVLETVNLPSTLATISSAAFYWCDNLKTINCKAAAAPALVEASAGWGDHFKGYSSWDVIGLNCTINVPNEAAKESYNTYKDGAGTWSYWDVFYGAGKVVVSEQTATSMTEAIRNASVQKVVRDGQVLILRDGKFFTLTGTQVQ